ncbi:hypothetical protein ASG29_12745 [Sphingomonas sp. Leaf412]|uniref:hypothetical protein n=1 Tax=Sphingomonas sp. Leaf412 TaxID=1736370 RepID=UPI0006F842F3|nr:hypothetical protein [Sphingomonas sp. Leaf412]KQT32996.1 hypothetical protein ASG29_12745 [Sphingomonas sp. Leaf412]
MAADRLRHFAAVDWSGAVGQRQRGIAVAICGTDGAPALVRPGHVWSRAEVLDWLNDGLPVDTLVGLDLGIALPFVDRAAYFPGWTESPPDARALWALVDRLCADDADLSAGSFVAHEQASRHFRRHGGRVGDLFQPGRGRLRATEHAQAAAGLNPCSNLNLVGAAQVGKSSLTGMRVLHRLPRTVAIWPFDPVPAAGPVVVEIYTALAAIAAGRRKGRAKMRTAADLDTALIAIGSPPSDLADPVSDHQCDALLTAAWLRTVAHDPRSWRPAGMTREVAATEGWTFGVG